MAEVCNSEGVEEKQLFRRPHFQMTFLIEKPMRRLNRRWQMSFSCKMRLLLMCMSMVQPGEKKSDAPFARQIV